MAMVDMEAIAGSVGQPAKDRADSLLCRQHLLVFGDGDTELTLVGVLSPVAGVPLPIDPRGFTLPCENLLSVAHRVVLAPFGAITGMLRFVPLVVVRFAPSASEKLPAATGDRAEPVAPGAS